MAMGELHIYERNRAIVPAPFELGPFYRGKLTGDPLGMVEFSISDQAADGLSKRPEDFLAQLGDRGSWKPTPADLQSVRLAGDCATFWCLKSKPSDDAAAWLQAPGSYYRRWGNSDAFVIVVNPARKRLVLGYFYA